MACSLQSRQDRRHLPLALRNARLAHHADRRRPPPCPLVHDLPCLRRVFRLIRRFKHDALATSGQRRPRLYSRRSISFTYNIGRAWRPFCPTLSRLAQCPALRAWRSSSTSTSRPRDSSRPDGGKFGGVVRIFAGSIVRSPGSLKVPRLRFASQRLLPQPRPLRGLEFMIVDLTVRGLPLFYDSSTCLTASRDQNTLFAVAQATGQASRNQRCHGVWRGDAPGSRSASWSGIVLNFTTFHGPLPPWPVGKP